MSNALGTPFGRYVLLQELSRGGMGRVYRALMQVGPGLCKQVAIKRLLRSVSTDADFVARFADEARIACSLNHANIVQVFDFGQVDGEYYLTMELVDGVDLSRLIKATRAAGSTIPLPAALFIAAGMCRGLGAAHRRIDASGNPAPVVHRDVSPHNVLVSRGGDVKVTDFGIATAAERAMRTRTGLIVGKCRYLSPEQVVGASADVRADIFACGCVLFEMLAGRPLFDAATPKQTLYALAHGPTPALDQACRAAPPALLDVLTRALQRDPLQRHPNATVLAKELERILRAISPAFSADDLATLVALRFPSRAPCKPASAELSVAPTVSSPLPGQNGVGTDLARSTVDCRPTLHSAQTQLLARATGDDRADAIGATETDTRADSDRRPMGEPVVALVGVRRAHGAAICLALAVAGAAAGALAVRASTDARAASASSPRSLEPNRPLVLGKWTLRLQTLAPVGRAPDGPARLLVRIAISHPNIRLSREQPFRVRTGTQTSRPIVFWQWNESRELLLVLSAPARAQRRLVLSFEPPGDNDGTALLSLALPGRS